MAEFVELQRLARKEEFDTALLRGCSFVEHFLKENVDWLRGAPATTAHDEDPSLAKVVNYCRKAGFLNDIDQKLLHFVREVRNNSAHHAWLTKDLDPEVARTADRALLYVIVVYCRRKPKPRVLIC